MHLGGRVVLHQDAGADDVDRRGVVPGAEATTLAIEVKRVQVDRALLPGELAGEDRVGFVFDRLVEDALGVAQLLDAVVVDEKVFPGKELQRHGQLLAVDGPKVGRSQS